VVTAKPFDISKQEVWDAYKRVKANRGAAGVDEQSIAEFEADLPNNLYKLWNRRAATFHPRGRDPEGNGRCPHAGHSDTRCIRHLIQQELGILRVGDFAGRWDEVVTQAWSFASTSSVIVIAYGIPGRRCRAST
jgi:hypothetical protein